LPGWFLIACANIANSAARGAVPPPRRDRHPGVGRLAAEVIRQPSRVRLLAILAVWPALVAFAGTRAIPLPAFAEQ
jgi:hypothetical protein